MQDAISGLAQILADALADADRSLADEHAVRGIDALDETDLHPILAGALENEGRGVHREAHYPGDHDGRDAARDRCDLVVTEAPGAELLDPVHADRRLRQASGTLFADLAPDMEATATANAVRPADALWIEIKAVAQHVYRDGVPGPNRSYAAEMVNGPAADVCKLMGDGVIEHAAACLVLFTETEDIARHDTDAVAHALLDMGLPIGSPELASAPIADRAGNATVSVALYPLRGLGIGIATD